MTRAHSTQAPVRLVAVGSTNPAKVAAVESVLWRVYPGATIQAVVVSSGVAAMPLCDEDMVEGALARAKVARTTLDADLGVGLEGGAHHSPWGWLLSGWVAVVDRQGSCGLGSAGRLVLPPPLADAISQGEELGPAMDRLAGLTDTRRGPGAVGILTNELVRRDEAFGVGLAYALARFLHPEWYGSGHVTGSGGP
jgi:inosine/xanthosine triphosphatase